MSEPIRVGVLGAGGIAAKLHLPELTEAPGCTVTKLAGRRHHRLECLQERFGVPEATDDYEQLVQDPNVDALVIATPHNQHVSWACAALRAGKHILVQKPLCADREEADALLEMARSTDRVVFCLPHAAAPTHRAAQMADGGTLGRLTSLRARAAHGGPELYYREVAEIFGEEAPEKDLWFFDEQKAGVGALFDMGVYAVAQLVAVAGTMREVRATTATVAKPTTLEDTAVVTMTTADGAVAVAETSWCDPARTGTLSVHGTEGKIEIPPADVSEHPMLHFTPQAANSDRAPVTCRPLDPGAGLGNAHEQFMACIREGSAPRYAHPAAARHVADILLAALESGQRGEPVATRTRMAD
jgi:predicted dehydrogenase